MCVAHKIIGDNTLRAQAKVVLGKTKAMKVAQLRSLSKASAKSMPRRVTDGALIIVYEDISQLLQCRLDPSDARRRALLLLDAEGAEDTCTLDVRSAAHLLGEFAD